MIGIQRSRLNLYTVFVSKHYSSMLICQIKIIYQFTWKIYLSESTGVSGNESTHSCTVTGDLLRGVWDGDGVQSNEEDLPLSPSATLSIMTLGMFKARSLGRGLPLSPSEDI